MARRKLAIDSPGGDGVAGGVHTAREEAASLCPRRPRRPRPPRRSRAARSPFRRPAWNFRRRSRWIRARSKQRQQTPLPSPNRRRPPRPRAGPRRLRPPPDHRRRCPRRPRLKRPPAAPAVEERPALAGDRLRPRRSAGWPTRSTTASARSTTFSSRPRGANLSDSDRGIVERVRSFVQLSDQAAARGEMRQADGLSERALVMARELRNAR